MNYVVYKCSDCVAQSQANDGGQPLICGLLKGCGSPALIFTYCATSTKDAAVITLLRGHFSIKIIGTLEIRRQAEQCVFMFIVYLMPSDSCI